MYSIEDIGKKDKVYGGVITDVSALEIGTEFFVHNGCWTGRVVKFNCKKGKGVEVYDSTKISSDGNLGKLVVIKPMYDNAEDNLFAISVYKKSMQSKGVKINDNETKNNGDEAKDNGDEANVNVRHTMLDEYPCSFCDIGLGYSGGVCPYKNKSDLEKMKECRSFLYFELLKKYEIEAFGKYGSKRLK